ncbi:hypothetical protein ACWGDT_41165 [Streptomyces avermitilis]
MVFTDRLLVTLVHLRTLADVFAYAEAEDVTLCIDGTETQVRRPKAGRPGGRVSDRAAKRAARHRPSTELMPAFPADC